MRKISLGEVRKNSNNSKDRYSVYLDREHKYYFSSKKNAEKFVVKANKVINKHCHIINKKLGEAYQLYRTYFFHLENVPLSRVINQNLSSVDEILNHTLKHGSSPYALPLERMLCAYAFLDSIFNNLLAIAYKKADRSNELQFSIMLDELDMSRRDLQVFETKLQTRLKQVPIIQLKQQA